uniref:CID domain-containing protein n=1 Tax=Electrophorus electricus TaxID=8005 RepID=A0A4W4DMT4_ELEEL
MKECGSCGSNCVIFASLISHSQLLSLMDMKPPISRAKMMSITKAGIKAIKLYKHVVQIIEKFIKRCSPELKVPGLYVVDSIIRQSRHQFGEDKDVFGPRFLKNITITFQSLYQCPPDDKAKILRVLDLWQKNCVFGMDIIQPLLDMATASLTPVLENGSMLEGAELHYAHPPRPTHPFCFIQTHW